MQSHQRKHFQSLLHDQIYFELGLSFDLKAFILNNILKILPTILKIQAFDNKAESTLETLGSMVLSV